MNERREELRKQLKALGFDQVRFARVSERRGSERQLQDWLALGYHADMEWMSRTAEKRCDPELVLPGAKSVVLLGINYWPGDVVHGIAKWARYALYEDYHDTLKSALEEAGRLLEQFYSLSSNDYRYYVDTGPVLERSWAERGGMGFVGKNAMLISREFGNWLFLAELLTRVDLEPDAPLGKPPVTPAGEYESNGRVGLYCGHCTRCMDACPTGAIKGAGLVDARRCVSYQTIENRGIIPRELRTGIGSRIYGCDICLEVCPWNRFAQESRRVLLKARFDLTELSLLEILTMTPERFAEVFRKTPIKRTKLTGLLRNACIVAANTMSVDCTDAVQILASHPAGQVRAHAVWALARLLGWELAAEKLQVARALERDPLVLAEYLHEEDLHRK